MALETEAPKQITDAVVQILDSCILTRGVKIQRNKNHNKIVKLDDSLSLKLKYPSMDSFIESNFEGNTNDNDVTSTINMITKCIDVIYNEEESWNASESTKQELEEFIDQLDTKQFQTIEKFFDTMPKLSHRVKVKNPKTEVESTVILEGLAAFFN